MPPMVQLLPHVPDLGQEGVMADPTWRPRVRGWSPRTRPACPHHEDRASNLAGPVRDTNVLSQWRTVSRAVRRTRTESGDAHAGRAPRGPIDPTSPWEAPGVHVGAARGTRGPLEAGAVSVQSLVLVNF